MTSLPLTLILVNIDLCHIQQGQFENHVFDELPLLYV